MLRFCPTGDIDAFVPCHNPTGGWSSTSRTNRGEKREILVITPLVAGLFSMFGRASLKWVHLDLQSRARLADGKNGGSYLSNSSSTNDQHQRCCRDDATGAGVLRSSCSCTGRGSGNELRVFTRDRKFYCKSPIGQGYQVGRGGYDCSIDD